MATLSELQTLLQKKTEELLIKDRTIETLQAELIIKNNRIAKLVSENEKLQNYQHQSKPKLSVVKTTDFLSAENASSSTSTTSVPPETKSQTVLSTPLLTDWHKNWFKDDSANDLRVFYSSNRKVPLKKTKRLAVSAESAEFQPTTTADRRKIMTRVGKDMSTKELLNKAIQDNELLQKLDAFQVREVVDCMHAIEFSKDSLIIKEGGQGSLLFAVEEAQNQSAEAHNQSLEASNLSMEGLVASPDREREKC
ncbi:hypothetical protein HELRODRAFT_190069 [Helobdella robusta]|uniref:Cyclic nucleotide-binding domain-containing protein n=1 Tax=Helobdella robusta TaxID=6412 RepID=T1FRN3_HELRO|nr:hypothetical protein HELRODRAFT_190069 [Helobdella robusta]ESO11875.1 hypothetical protein HELRODRAFT_190069 [Helobdella robusta]